MDVLRSRELHVFPNPWSKEALVADDLRVADDLHARGNDVPRESVFMHLKQHAPKPLLVANEL